MGAEIFVPLGLFSMIAAIVVVPTWLKARTQREMQATIRHAIEKGQTLPVELIEAVAKQYERRRATAHSDLRAGVLWLALALGVGTTFGILGSVYDTDLYGFAAWAAIPGFIGAALIVLSFFNKTKD